MSKDLFREEAIRHRTRALFGDVILAAPLSTWIITGLLIVITACLIGFGFWAHIEGVDGPVPLWRYLLGLEK